MGRRLLLMAGENLIFNINEKSPRAPFVVRGCVFLGSPPFEEATSTPFSSDKIRAKILNLGYGGARRALHNLSPKSARILSAAITIDGLPGARTNALAPRRG